MDLRRLARNVGKLVTYPAVHRNSLVRQKLYSAVPALERLHSELCEYRFQRATGAPVVPAERYIVSIPHKSTGIGHALGEWNTGLSLAMRCGMTFVHVDLPERWETVLDFGAGEMRYDALRQVPGLRRVRLPRIAFDAPDAQRRLEDMLRSYAATAPTAFVLFERQNLYDHTQTAEVLRAKYRAAPISKLAPRREGQDIVVGVHIRRGDVTLMRGANAGDWARRFVDLDYFAHLMRIVADELGPRAIFRLFSQGSRSEFAELERIGRLEYWLDCDDRQSFAALVDCDVILLSPSNFSYFAGIISEGVKVGLAGWYHHVPDDDEWVRVERDPASVAARLGARLRRRFGATAGPVSA
jgi:hypothetical protein